MINIKIQYDPKLESYDIEYLDSISIKEVAKALNLIVSDFNAEIENI